MRGDASSWAKVLCQAGFGNGGSVPETNPDDATAARDAAASARGAETWAAYAADRPWVAPSPDEEAAATILRRRDAIRDDAALPRTRQPYAGIVDLCGNQPVS